MLAAHYKTLFSDCYISIDASHNVISLLMLLFFCFETCGQIPASEIENCAVKRLDYPYLRVFLKANIGYWSPWVIFHWASGWGGHVVTVTVNFTLKSKWAQVLVPLFIICPIETDTVVHSAMQYNDVNSSKHALRGNTTQG